MKAGLLKLLQRKERNGKTFTTRNSPGLKNSNHRVISFLVCLFIAFLLWFISTLSKKYTENLTFGIEYSNFPQPKKSFTYSDTMKLKVNLTGFRLIAYKMGFIDEVIKVDAGQFKHRDNAYQYNINNHVHETKIEEQLGEEVKLLDITPDTLFIRPI